jgi:hypothetical protein
MLVDGLWGEDRYELRADDGAHFTGHGDSALVADTPAERAASAARVAALREAAIVNRTARRARLAQIPVDWAAANVRYEADEASLVRARVDLIAAHRATLAAFEDERRALEIEESQLDPEGVAAQELEDERRIAAMTASLDEARREYGLDPVPGRRADPVRRSR